MTYLAIAALVALPLAFSMRCVFCSDGWLSHSLGRRGACSHHGGWRK
jgi:hypothetical protein